MTTSFKEILLQHTEILQTLDFDPTKFSFEEFQKEYEKIIKEVDEMANPSLSENKQRASEIKTKIEGLVDKYGVVPFMIYNSIKFNEINLDEFIDLTDEGGNKVNFTQDLAPFISEKLLEVYKNKVELYQGILDGRCNVKVGETGYTIKDFSEMFWKNQEEKAPGYKGNYTAEQQQALSLMWVCAKSFETESHAPFLKTFTRGKVDCSSASYLVYALLMDLKDPSGKNIFKKEEIEGLFYMNEQHFQLRVKGKNYEAQSGAFPGDSDEFKAKPSVSLDALGMVSLQMAEETIDRENNLLGAKVAYVMSDKNYSKVFLMRAYSNTIKSLINNDKEYEAYKLFIENPQTATGFSISDLPYNTFYGVMAQKYEGGGYLKKIEGLKTQYNKEILDIAKAKSQEGIERN